MVEKTLELCRQLGAASEWESMLPAMAQGVCTRLAGQLRCGVKPEDCGEAFPMAAAISVMELFHRVDGTQGLSAVTVGEVTIRKQSPDSEPDWAARELLGPWLCPGFAAMGAWG